MKDVFLIISAYVWIRNNASSDFILLVSKSPWVSIQNPFCPWSKQLQQPVKSRVHRLYLSRLDQHCRQNRSPAERLCTVHTSRTDSHSRVLLLQLRLAGFAFSVPPSGVTETLERVLPQDVLLQERKWVIMRLCSLVARQHQTPPQFPVRHSVNSDRLFSPWNWVWRLLPVFPSSASSWLTVGSPRSSESLGLEKVGENDEVLMMDVSKTMMSFSSASVCVCVCLTEVLRHVLQVRFDDSRMEVFVVSEQLQISRVVLEIRLSDRRKHPITTRPHTHTPASSIHVSEEERPSLTLSFSELSSSCLISFSRASLTACLVTERMASYTNRTQIHQRSN